MKLLLDTNALLWQIGIVKGSKLGRQAKRLIEEADMVYVSAISIVEMQIKTINGKLDAPKDCMSMVVEAGDVILPLYGEVADNLRRFPELARHDPFDRMLLAQASSEQLTLMTADTILLGLGLDYVVDARF